MKDLSKSDLAQFTGSERWFRHSFARAVLYTEGVAYVAEHGDAYWLIDAIASHLVSRAFNAAAVKDERIGLLHFWKLAVRGDHGAVLTAEADAGEPPFIRQEIPFTDFPLDEIRIWAGNDGQHWTLILPSEY